jgi:hypothetical protein
MRQGMGSWDGAQGVEYMFVDDMCDDEERDEREDEGEHYRERGIFNSRNKIVEQIDCEKAEQ